MLRRPRWLTRVTGLWQVLIEKGLVDFRELRNIGGRHCEGEGSLQARSRDYTV